MALNYSLPTTSTLSFSSFLRCDSHPSLLLSATTQRSVLRSALKQHKRLPPSDQASNLSNILSAITSYLPYLLALERGLAGHLVASESIFVALTSEPETEWRSSILSPPPGRQSPRLKGKGLDYEILFVLATAAYTHCLDARRHLAPHAAPGASSRFSPDQRKAAHNAAANSLLTAHSIFTHAARVSETVPASSIPPSALDIQTTTLSALAELAFAYATLLEVIKNDDFLVLAAQARDSTDREWMYRAPEIPKVRAHLFARLCLAAADRASRAVALLSSTANVREDLLKYARDLDATARARSCRFFGVDAEIAGKLGDALGWLNAGRRKLGLPVGMHATAASPSAEKSKFKPSLTAMKTSWAERKERKGLESSRGPSLDDPGRVEEGRVLEMLEKSWGRTNDLIGHQLVTDEGALLQTMPSGREIHAARAYVVPGLDAGALERARAPPERDEEVGDSEDSGDEILGEGMPGAWDDRDRGDAGVGRSGTGGSSSQAYY